MPLPVGPTPGLTGLGLAASGLAALGSAAWPPAAWGSAASGPSAAWPSAASGPAAYGIPLPSLGSVPAVAAYAVLAALVFAESGILLGFFLPGDTVLVAAGLLSGGRHPRLSLPVLLLVVVVAAVSGDAVGYWFGRTTRRALPTSGRRARHLERARGFYDRYGAFAVVAARWIPWVRVFTPVLAGAAHMRYRRFLPANVIGAVAWAATLLIVGHAGAQLR